MSPFRCAGYLVHLEPTVTYLRDWDGRAYQLQVADGLSATLVPAGVPVRVSFDPGLDDRGTPSVGGPPLIVTQIEVLQHLPGGSSSSSSSIASSGFSGSSSSGSSSGVDDSSHSYSISNSMSVGNDAGASQGTQPGTSTAHVTMTASVTSTGESSEDHAAASASSSEAPEPAQPISTTSLSTGTSGSSQPLPPIPDASGEPQQPAIPWADPALAAHEISVVFLIATICGQQPAVSKSDMEALLFHDAAPEGERTLEGYYAQ